LCINILNNYIIRCSLFFWFRIYK